jgi:hypothetical protein
MEIEILKSTVGDKRTLRAGKIEDVSEQTAWTLIRLKKARIPEPATEQPAKQKRKKRNE